MESSVDNSVNQLGDSSALDASQSKNLSDIKPISNPGAAKPAAPNDVGEIGDNLGEDADIE